MKAKTLRRQALSILLVLCIIMGMVPTMAAAAKDKGTVLLTWQNQRKVMVSHQIEKKVNKNQRCGAYQRQGDGSFVLAKPAKGDDILSNREKSE